MPLVSGKPKKAVVRGANGLAKKVDGLAEKLAEEIQERMRGAHSRFHLYYAHDRVGVPPGLPFFGDDDGIPSRRSEVSQRVSGSNEINGSVGFVERRFRIVHCRNDRREGNT